MKANEYLESKFNDNTRSFTRYDMIEFAKDYSKQENKELIEFINEIKKGKPLSVYGEGYLEAINDVRAILNNKTNDKNE